MIDLVKFIFTWFCVTAFAITVIVGIVLAATWATYIHHGGKLTLHETLLSNSLVAVAVMGIISIVAGIMAAIIFSDDGEW